MIRRKTGAGGDANGTTLVALAALALLGGCEAQEDRRPAGGTAVIAYGGAPAAANPFAATDAYSQEMNRFLLFLPLVEHTPDLDLAPRLAESWAAEGDSALVLRLRQDVRWSDGTAVTAHDAAFTLERALDPETGYPNQSRFEHMRRVTVEDSFTLRIQIEPVREPMAALPLLPVLPRHVLDTVPVPRLGQAPFNLRPVTSGPFRVVEARPGDRWIFEANESFPDELGGPPRIDRLVWRAIPESASQLAELRAGEVDLVVGVRAEAFDREAPGLRPLERPTLSYTGVAWNSRRPHLRDRRVREALTRAIDREQIVAALRRGYGTVAVDPIPISHWAGVDAPPPLPHDVQEARRLLAEAGYNRETGRDDLRLSLLIPAGSDFNRDLAQVIQEHLRRAGVRLDIRALEFATLIETITSPARDFDAVLIALDADPRLDLRPLFHTTALDGPFQVAGMSDPSLDSILDRLELASDREEARALWGDARRIIAREQPWSYLYHLTDLILVRDRLQGVEADLRGILHSVPAWWVERPDHDG